MLNSTLTSNSDPYMVNAAWNELGTMFTVTEPTTVTISLVQNMKNSGRSDIAWDNLRLYQIENVSENKPMDVSGLITTSNYYASVVGISKEETHSKSTLGLQKVKKTEAA